jgi:predicted helicase
MTIEGYIKNLNQRYRLGNATEHTFRGDLQQLLEAILPGIAATNEPKRQSCGAPDYILTRNEIPVGFIEAKDIGDQDLEGKKKSGNKEQFDRYKASLSNLIFTDYLDFHLYQDGIFITKIAIAEIVDNQIKAIPQNFKDFTDLFKDFTDHKGQTIKSSKKLAEMMAGKARLLSNVIEKSLTSDETNHEDSTLKEQMIGFKDVLIHDITPRGFADVYAQTIAYGLFAARLHDPTLDTFSRQEAAELIPKSNPFLRKLFNYIAGPDIDDRIKWIVENLSEIFLACNVEVILKNYGKSTKMEDPIIHFYENFLAEYDPKLRKARGVWYTPAPVVNFIVRAVDDILKTEFNLPQGLADTSKTKIKVKTQTPNKNFKSGYKEIEQETHRVQILDPASGTGTFLAEVVKHVNKKFKGQEGIWSSYVENHLLPRLNGFELLMASYAMAHLQLDLLLKQTGFKATKTQRTKIYLTNSLEKYHPDTGTLFAKWLSSEANEANYIKRDTPVMCIIGNPPYSGESANKGKWIMDLMQDYKKEPGGKEKLKERNPKFINDDYVKFLRYGQHFIEKNGSGVLAFINPHGFLDNPTFRGMRWNLLKTYDKIYTIDLHGNSNIKETCPDGSPDINVFDIQQGVSITIFVKTGKKKSNNLGKVFHYDLFGKRDDKYAFLSSNSLKTIPYTELSLKAPMFYMVPRDYQTEEEYNKGFLLNELFIKSTIGVQTHRDDLVIDIDKSHLIKRFKDIFSNDDKPSLISKYNIKESNHWKLNNVIEKEKTFNENELRKITYRPFDEREIYYNESFVDRTRRSVGSELNKDNLVLHLAKIVKSEWNHTLITKSIPTAISMDINGTYFTPLYIYPKLNRQQTIEKVEERKPNLNQEIVDVIAKKLDLVFTNEKDTTENTFSPIDILDYIYAVLHSPTYREKYNAFLKTGFPKVTYPKNQNTFWQLVKLGSEIRQLHLLESPKVEEPITNYRGEGDNIITRKITKSDIGYEPTTDTHGKVWINDTQYFDNVPLIAWDFYIGGYQPAQKWLKDRKGRVLGFEDIFHYGKIIISLTDTHRIMQEIDTINIK